MSMMNKIVQKYSDLKSTYPKLPNEEVHKIIEQAKKMVLGKPFCTTPSKAGYIRRRFNATHRD